VGSKISGLGVRGRKRKEKLVGWRHPRD
jgi:hypothetical protein